MLRHGSVFFAVVVENSTGTRAPCYAVYNTFHLSLFERVFLDVKRKCFINAVENTCLPGVYAFATERTKIRSDSAAPETEQSPKWFKTAMQVGYTENPISTLPTQKLFAAMGVGTRLKLPTRKNPRANCTRAYFV